MTQFNIEIVSDAVCPWCYVGKKKLENAISEYKSKHPDQSDTFSTTWMPFYLNPDSPKIGVDKAQYYKEKFGIDRTSMIFDRLAAIGKDVGINFSFGGKTGNTRSAHRLVQLGKTKSPAVQTKVIEALFEAYFEKEKDITSMATLQAAGEQAGLNPAEVKDWLESDKGGPEVDREVLNAKMQQISGVPNFTVNGKYEVGGAQDSAVFVDLFERIKAGEGAAKKSTAETC